MDISMGFVNTGFCRTLCDPHSPSHLAAFRSGLLEVCLQRAETGDREAKRLISDILSWLCWTRGVEASTESVSHVLAIIRRFPRYTHDSMAPSTLLLALALESVKTSNDPWPLLSEAASHIHEDDVEVKAEESERFQDDDLALFLIGRLLQLAPSNHHGHLSDITMKILDRGASRRFNRWLLGFLEFCVLQTLPYKNQISQPFTQILRRLKEMQVAGEETSFTPIKLGKKFFTPEEAEARATIDLMYSLTKEEDLTEWLLGLKSQGRHSECCPSSVLMAATAVGGRSLAQIALELLVSAGEDPGASPEVKHAAVVAVMRTLALSAASEAEAPSLRLVALHLLPTLATVDRGTVGFVLHTLRSLGGRPGLAPLRLHLMYKLWRRERRIYPHLLAALEETPHTSVQSAMALRLAKAKVAVDICEIDAAGRGPDLLPLLSTILSDCNRSAHGGEVVTSTATIAMRGIARLCLQRVIDVVTTVEVLWPHFKEPLDPREAVATEFLRLLALMPSFKLSSETSQAFRRRLLTRLWAIFWSESDSFSANLKLQLAKTIGAFPSEDHTLSSFPNYCKDSLSFPQGYQPSPEEPDLTPEQLLNFIPGDCWIKLITRNPSEEGANALAATVAMRLHEEVAALPRGVYGASKARAGGGSKGGHEPANYGALPESSILRASVSHLLGVARERATHDGAAIGSLPLGASGDTRDELVLALLAQPFERPLPPFDWLLLESIPCKRELLLQLAVNQCGHSRSSLDIVLASLSRKESLLPSTLSVIFRGLAELVPVLSETFDLKEFIVDTFVARPRAPPGIPDPYPATQLLESLAACMNDSESVREAVRCIFLGHAEICKDGDDGGEVTQALYKLIARMPKDELELVTHVDTRDDLKKTLELVHCSACDTATALAKLTNAVEACTDAPHDFELHRMTRKAVLITLRSTRSTEEGQQSARRWLLELMGFVRALKRRPETQPDAVDTAFDFFALAAAALARLDLLADFKCKTSTNNSAEVLEKKEMSRWHALMPLAVERLSCNVNGASMGPQMGEWLAGSSPPAALAATVKAALPALRYADCYLESLWSRLVPS